MILSASMKISAVAVMGWMRRYSSDALRVIGFIEVKDRVRRFLFIYDLTASALFLIGLWRWDVQLKELIYGRMERGTSGCVALTNEAETGSPGHHHRE